MLNNITGICLPNESFYSNERVKKVVLDNFQGIAFAGLQGGYSFYLKNKKVLNRSLSLNGSIMDKNLRCYIDEPISTPNENNKNLDDIIKKYPNAIIGELEKDIMLDLKKKYPDTSLTYTAFREWWGCISRYFKIRKWWKDQSRVWSWMFVNVRTEILWVNLTLNNNIKELTKIAKSYNKEVWLYVEADLTIDEFLTNFKLIETKEA